jgi:hypothetical protein
MNQPGQCLDLPLKAFAVLTRAFMHHLKSNNPVLLAIVSKIDISHPSPREMALHLVPSYFDLL